MTQREEIPDEWPEAFCTWYQNLLDFTPAQMWPYWQAAQAQAAVEPVAFLETITGQVRLPDDEHRVRFPKAYEPLYKTTQAAPGDIRALKYRIHELEGEVIGYKRILDAQDKANTCTSDEWLSNCPQSVRDLANKIKGEKE